LIPLIRACAPIPNPATYRQLGSGAGGFS